MDDGKESLFSQAFVFLFKNKNFFQYTFLYISMATIIHNLSQSYRVVDILSQGADDKIEINMQYLQSESTLGVNTCG